MYSHEITRYLEERNYQITPREFTDIINSSPQVCDVYYNKENGEEFRFVTTDNFSWTIKLKEDKYKKLKLSNKENKRAQ
jgi:hypothetical protein